MEIHFRDKTIRDLCEQSKIAQRTLGTDCARKLKTRLSDLEAVDCVTDLVAGNPHPLKGNRAGQFSLNLAGGYRLVFAPNHSPTPLKDDQSIDWSQVTIISIEFIGDYHD